MRSLSACLLFAVQLLLVPGPATAAESLPREIEIDGIEFVLIPEGWFWYSVERPFGVSGFRLGDPLFREVRVWLGAYYLAKFPARSRDFLRFLQSGQSRFAGQLDAIDENCSLRRDADGRYRLLDPSGEIPATGLSWQLADEFARWLGFRLPTEAEWEKAARGADRRHWPWGNEFPDDTYANFAANLSCMASPVGRYPKGASPFGVFDMAGNVAEHVLDWANTDFDEALRDGVRNPGTAAFGAIRESGQEPAHILKGGHWNSQPGDMTIHTRLLDEPYASFYNHGVRFALDVDTARKRLAGSEPPGRGR